jgi:hypothetical protein
MFCAFGFNSHAYFPAKHEKRNCRMRRYWVLLLWPVALLVMVITALGTTAPLCMHFQTA